MKKCVVPYASLTPDLVGFLIFFINKTIILLYMIALKHLNLILLYDRFRYDVGKVHNAKGVCFS